MFLICHVDKLLSETEASISLYVIKTSRQTFNFFLTVTKRTVASVLGSFLEAVCT